ncbi:MAG: FAD-binding domain-containing protein [Gammaproteobacteria bacterium]
MHAPWQMTALEQQMCGIEIGRTYPAPIIDHAMIKARTLAAYRG